MFLLREEPTREGPLTSPPREGRPIAIFVVASILGHVALVAAAPAVVGPMLADAPADDLVFIDLPPEPEPEAVVQPLPEPEEPEVVPEPAQGRVRVAAHGFELASGSAGRDPIPPRSCGGDP
mgnify:CR=1 FL=1